MGAAKARGRCEQHLDGAVPDVTRVVHEAVAHLHLGILEPEGDAVVVDVQRSLPYTARSPEVLLGLLPLRVLKHDAASASRQQAGLVTNTLHDTLEEQLWVG